MPHSRPTRTSFPSPCNRRRVDNPPSYTGWRPGQRFERALRVAFQNDAEMFLSVSRLEQTFKGGTLRCGQFVRAAPEEPLFAQHFRGSLRFHHEKFIAGLRQPAETEHFYRR